MPPCGKASGELKAAGKDAEREKGAATAGACLFQDPPVRDGLKQQKYAKAKAAYRQQHESDFIIADAAARYFRENGISKLPTYKALQAEIETLIPEKDGGYNDYRTEGRNTAAYRPSSAISTRFYAGTSRTAERAEP